MADRVNFLIGYGERLASEIAAPVAGAPKRHPYTLFEARERLAPMVIQTAHELDELPNVVCPADHAVALITLHPSYLAKSYYPRSEEAMKSDLVDVAGEIQGETDKAFRFFDGARTVWLPKSQCEWDSDDSTMAMPEWLAKDKELI